MNASNSMQENDFHSILHFVINIIIPEWVETTPHRFTLMMLINNVRKPIKLFHNETSFALLGTIQYRSILCEQVFQYLCDRMVP